MEPTSYYTQDNTTGYTDAELHALNAELCGILTPLYANDGCPDLDTVNAIIKRHNNEVAGR